MSGLVQFYVHVFNTKIVTNSITLTEDSGLVHNILN